MSRSRPPTTLARFGRVGFACLLAAAVPAGSAHATDVAAAAPAAAESAAGGTVFTFNGEVPAGWTKGGKVLAHEAVVVVGDGSGVVSLLCTPMQPAAGPVVASVTRAFVIPEGEVDTWSRIEVRVFGADKKRLAGASPLLLSAVKVGSSMSIMPLTFTLPEGAASWRLCLKTGGAGRGSTVVKEIRLP